MIRDQAQSWATEQAPVSAFRKVRDAGLPLRYEPATWEAMVEMGWTGILIPEEFGGSDLGYLTFGVVLEQLGRQLTASPLYASALVGASALLIGGSDAQKQHFLPKIVDGSEILTLALDEGPRHAPDRVAATAEERAGDIRINGAKTMVLEGMAATTFVVAAQGADGLGLYLVPADAEGISRQALSTMDSRGYANVQFQNVSVAADARVGDSDALAELLDRARAGLGAEMLGTSAQAFDMTLEYLKTREQFGRVIGSFQALGHRAADLFSQLELTRSCVEAALTAVDEQAEDRAELCALSKARASAYLHEMSNQLIQIHGGIGMTDEFDAGLYLKRARPLEQQWGNAAFHRDRYATLLGF